MNQDAILLAHGNGESRDIIISYFNAEYTIYLPSTMDELFLDPFIDSSLAVIDECFMTDRGLEALKNIKSAKPSMPVIFIAAGGSEALCRQVFRMGASDYFSSPLDVEELVRSITQLMEIKYRNERFRSVPFLNDGKICRNPKTKKEKRELTGLEKARAYIEENYSKPLSLDHLAKVAGVSKYHFVRKFKELTGMTCCRFQNFVKLREVVYGV